MKLGDTGLKVDYIIQKLRQYYPEMEGGASVGWNSTNTRYLIEYLSNYMPELLNMVNYGSTYLESDPINTDFLESYIIQQGYKVALSSFTVPEKLPPIKVLKYDNLDPNKNYVLSFTYISQVYEDIIKNYDIQNQVGYFKNDNRDYFTPMIPSADPDIITEEDGRYLHTSNSDLYYSPSVIKEYTEFIYKVANDDTEKKVEFNNVTNELKVNGESKNPSVTYPINNVTYVKLSDNTEFSSSNSSGITININIVEEKFESYVTDKYIKLSGTELKVYYPLNSKTIIYKNSDTYINNLYTFDGTKYDEYVISNPIPIPYKLGNYGTIRVNLSHAESLELHLPVDTYDINLYECDSLWFNMNSTELLSEGNVVTTEILDTILLDRTITPYSDPDDIEYARDLILDEENNESLEVSGSLVLHSFIYDELLKMKVRSILPENKTGYLDPLSEYKFELLRGIGTDE